MHIVVAPSCRSLNLGSSITAAICIRGRENISSERQWELSPPALSTCAAMERRLEVSTSVLEFHLNLKLWLILIRQLHKPWMGLFSWTIVKINPPFVLAWIAQQTVVNLKCNNKLLNFSLLAMTPEEGNRKIRDLPRLVLVMVNYSLVLRLNQTIASKILFPALVQ